MTREFDVVVAGGGLVGAAFAGLLAARCGGLSIAVVEARPFDHYFEGGEFDPRVVALTETSRRMLADVGVWDEVASRRVSPYTHMSVWDTDGTGFIEFDSAEVSAPCLGHIVENSNIVGALHQRLADFPNIEFICPSTVAAATRADGHIDIELDSGEQLATSLVVAADGALSKVRELCSFQLDEAPYDHSAIVATVRCELAHGATARQWFSVDGPLAFLPLKELPLTESPAAELQAKGGGDDHYVSIVWSQREGKASDLMALDDEAFCTALSRASERCLGQVEAVSKRFCFPLRQRHAEEYVQAGVALLGDAAHTIHPLAGQGVNLGFKDVVALVDELERAVKRQLPLGDMSVLGRYQRSRKPDNLATMMAMKGFKELFGADNLALRLVRNEGMSLVNRIGPLKKQLIRRAMGI